MNKTKAIKTAYLYDFQFLDIEVKEDAGTCLKIEICPNTGAYLRAYFRVIGQKKPEFWQRFRAGVGVVFERPILNGGKISEYYIKQAIQARKDNKNKNEITLLLDFARTAQRHEAEAEREEKKQKGLIKLKNQIWKI